MKQITYTILEHLKSFPRIPNYKLSHHSMTFLSKLFSLFIEGKKAFSKTAINKTFNTNTNKNSDTYIPLEIRESIDKRKKIRTDYAFSIHGRNISVSMYHFQSTSNAILNKYINRIFIWLYTALHFAPMKCSQNMQINIYFTNKNKNLPIARSPLNQNHANTAFTTSCSANTEINIFREEEWFKVLIHETFHCLGLDFSEMDKTRSNQLILKLFPVKSDVRLFETYCETWAEITNVMFISFFSTRNNDIEKMLQKTEIMLYYERLFSLIQCTKVLRHFGLTYEAIHTKSKQSENYKEETQILSYYILKSIYMFYHNDFIEWCLLNNGSTLNFKKTEENIEKYAEFIQQHYQKQEFLDTIQTIQDFHIKKTISNTLRMTVFELV
uniref:Uncharacterized protein n=1 Tax=viral metagenome TaxID=1070528 RepID=A0A6C0B276_9ZZZZ